MLYFSETIYSDFICIFYMNGAIYIYIYMQIMDQDEIRIDWVLHIYIALHKGWLIVLRQANEIKIMIYLRFIYISTKKKKRWQGFESIWETSWNCKKWLMDIDSHASIFYIVRLPWTLALRWPTVNQDKACYKKSHVNHKILQ